MSIYKFLAFVILFVTVALLSSLRFNPAFSETNSPSTSKIIQNNESLYPFRPTFKRLTFYDGPDTDPCWAPDASNLIFVSARDCTRFTWKLHKLSFVDSSISRIKTSSEINLHTCPRYSPIGEKIAFIGNLPDGAEMVLQDVSSGIIQRITYEQGNCVSLNWAPDGHSILYCWRESIFTDVYYLKRVNIDDGTIQQYLKNDEFAGLASASFSPEGNRFVFSGQEDKDDYYYLYIFDEETDEIIKFTDEQINDFNPSWSPDGRWIVFERGEWGAISDEYNIWICASEGGMAKKLTEAERDGTKFHNFNPSWSPDSKRLVISTDPVDNIWSIDVGVLSDFIPNAPYMWLTNHSIDDSQGNNNGLVQAGETIQVLLTLVNKGLDASHITIALSSDDQTISFEQTSFEINKLEQDQVITNTDSPFTFFVHVGTLAHTCLMNINIKGDGGFEQNESLEIKIGNPDPTSIDHSSVNQPARFSLAQNYPNPFNSETIIEYDISKSCHAKLAIYNLIGQEIRTLVDRQHPIGHFEAKWDGGDKSGRDMPAGVFLYTIEAEDFIETKKLLLLK